MPPAHRCQVHERSWVNKYGTPGASVQEIDARVVEYFNDVVLEIGQAQHAAQMPCLNERLRRIEGARQIAKVAGRAEPLGLPKGAVVGADELQVVDDILEYAGIDVV